MGRLELSGVQYDYSGTTDAPLFTFSEGRQQCVSAELGLGHTIDEAGANCTDGTTLARFDNTAVGSGALSATWTEWGDAVVTQPTVEGTTPVKVKVVKYASPGAAEVWAMVCAPNDGGTTPRRAIIYNHGGGAGTNAFDAAACLSYARRGWVFAMSSYRGEPLFVPNVPIPEFGWASWEVKRLGVPLATSLPSLGNIQISLGEVMDVHRLLQILVTQPNVNPNKLFMWGFSHGGSITLRALQSGAKVKAAGVFAPASDWIDQVHHCHGLFPTASPVSSEICYVVRWGTTGIPSLPTAAGFATLPPDPPSGFDLIARSYQWRSPLFFAGDLALRDDVTLLVQHGIGDLVVPVRQSCELVAESFESTHIANSWRAPATGPAGSFIPGTHPSCPGITFANVERPISNWSLNKRYFIAYDAWGHGAPPASPPGADLERYRTWLETNL
jgi:dienelactone hydrolase